jgi:hypothetical protein
MLKDQGGGELTTMGRDGLIRSKDIIASGHDPNTDSLQDRREPLRPSRSA